MAKQSLLPSLALVASLALIPAATASFAQTDVETYRQLEQFMTVFERVRSDYVEQVDDKTLLRGAIDGMLASLDPHSSYLDENGFRQMMTSTEGEYGGLGLNVTMEDSVVKVFAVTEDTPAFRAGLKSGDYLSHFNGKLVYGLTIDEAVSMMRGPPGSKVKITVIRPGRDKPFDVEITRALIQLPSVKWEVKDRVGIINVNGFSMNTTELAMAGMTAIEKSLGSKPLGYVVDLRSNPGGLLDQAIGLSDLFLDKGEIVSQRGRKKSDIERYYARPGDMAKGLPVVVLVDAGSASAAEIVAAALQEHRRAIVMGERSFGKGSVQTLLPLTQNTALRLTTDRYFTPSGRSVQEGGVTPDIEVPQLSDPDVASRRVVRESDLRRHLVNEIKVDDKIIQDDGKPDPRFAATPEELKKKGIEDFQLHYAIQSITRIGKVQSAAAAPAGGKKAGTR